MNKYVVIVVVVFSFVIVQLPPCLSELVRIEHPLRPTDDGSLMFLGIGDWGRRGKYSQKIIAKQMGIVAGNYSIEFIISTGDNFYGDGSHSDGLDGVDDYAFTASFTNVYKAKSLRQLRWYTVLGNHDYLNKIKAQLSPALQRKDARWYCYRSYVVNAGIADFFFVDTTPFKNSYYGRGDYDRYGFGYKRKDYYLQLVKDVESALKKSEARWKIVVAHHPIRSVGQHGDTEELVQLLLPILEANNVDFYINGHDHCMQHVKVDKRPNAIQFITTGGGSLAYTGEGRRNKRSDEEIIYYPGVGFMMAHITHTDAYITFFDELGEVFYHWTTHKSNKA